MPCYLITNCCSKDTDHLVFSAVYPGAGSVISITSQVMPPGTVNCWTVKETVPECSPSTPSITYAIQPDCQSCCTAVQTCYALRDCDTQQIIYTITYTVPNTNLPNPATLVGQTLGTFCFTPAHGGCIPGCYYFEILGANTDCQNAIDWTEVVSYVAYPSCLSCQKTCYLLVPCDPAKPSIVVSNDLSIYLNQVVNVCIDGTCTCYTVNNSQTCTGSISVPTPALMGNTCESCDTGCFCPPGYEKLGDVCQKITNVAATPGSVVYDIGPGTISDQYGNSGTNFYPNITSLPYPISQNNIPPSNFFLDGSLNPLAPVVNLNTPGTVWGPGNPTSRLNTVGLWTTALSGSNQLPLLQWIGFTTCINIPETKTYCIGLGSDNLFRFKIDGTLVVETADVNSTFNFNYWHVFEITLTQGFHVIELEGLNALRIAAFGAEIYNATSATLQTLTTVTQLQAVTIFSTFDKKTGTNVFETSAQYLNYDYTPSGYTCPPGTTLNNCNGLVCSLIETVPFIPCPPTYKVVDCDGILPDYITSTDLSAYVNNGYYKVCVTGTDSPDWPAGCYCVSVTDNPPVTAPAFTGVFGDNFTSCADCKRICYLLVNCKDNTDTIVVTGTSLADCVGGVVVIKDCADKCWQVFEAENCDGCTREVEVVECYPSSILSQSCTYSHIQLFDVTTTVSIIIDNAAYVSPVLSLCDANAIINWLNSLGHGIFTYTIDPAPPTLCPLITISVSGLHQYDILTLDPGGLNQQEFRPNCVSIPNNPCELCSPPVVPVVPEVKLHIRPVVPGYKPPVCSPEYYDKVNCNYSEQVTDKMISVRYGLKACCEDDLNKWDIKKELLDLKSIEDASFTKPLTCTCYIIEQVAETVTYNYINCAGCLTTVTLAPGDTVYVCSQTCPKFACSVENAISNITIGSDCTQGQACSPPPPPPPPATCYCYTVTVPSGRLPEPPQVTVTCNGVTNTYTNLTIGDYAYCSDVDPIVSAGLSFTKGADCLSVNCTTPIQCFCYTVMNNATFGGLEYDYINCFGELIFGTLDSGGTAYVCAQRDSVEITSGFGEITPGGTCTSDNDCQPCLCRIIENLTDTEGTVTYKACDGTQTSDRIPALTGLYICAQGRLGLTAGLRAITLNEICTTAACEEVCSCIAITNESTGASADIAYLDCNNDVQQITLGPGLSTNICGKGNSISQGPISVPITTVTISGCPCIL